MEKYYKASDIGALIEQLLRTRYWEHEGESWYSGVSAVWDELTNLTPIELEEPLYAQWKTREAKNDYLWVECSNCGFLVENYKAIETGKSSTDVIGYKWHACPKCTAKMTREDN